MRLLKLGAFAGACAVAVVGLTACTSKVGAAAIVNGSRISDNTVNSYLKPGAGQFSVTASDGSAQTIIPRSYVLQDLLEARLFEGALAQTSQGPATQAELDAAQASVLQGSTLEQFQATYAKYDFQPKFAQAELRLQELEQVLEQRVGEDSSDTTLSKTAAALSKVAFKVTLDPRYGSWDSKSYSINTSAADGLPSFISLKPAAAAPSASSDSTG